MGKRLPKSELLAEIDVERPKLVALLESTPRKILIRRGMNDDGWAIKDVLTHLVAWERKVNEWCETCDRGVNPVVPDEDFGWGDIRAINDRIFRSGRRKPLDVVLEEFENVHQTTLARIAELTDEQLTTLNYYEWTGKSWTLSDYLRANTASHYRWATKKIRKWLRQLT